MRVSTIFISLLLLISLIQTKNMHVKGEGIEPNSIIVIAHRGASAYAPEHTMAAYKLAHKLGADYLEIDLQMTSDGKLVAMHDDRVDRTTNGKGRVDSYTWEDLQKLDAGSWFNENHPEYADAAFVNTKVPSLEEIVDHFGSSANYYIETKSPGENLGMEEELLRILSDHHLLDSESEQGKVIIESFSEESLRKIHEMDAKIPLIQLLNYEKEASVTKDQLMKWKTYARGIGPNFSMINESFIQIVGDSGLWVHPYTIDTEKDMNKMIRYGVAGVFTNVADQLAQVADRSNTISSYEKKTTSLE